MKKTVFIAIVALGFGAISCSKNYTCECETVTTSGGISSTTTSEYEIEEASSKQASAACIEATIVNQSSNYTTERTCTLK